MLGMSESDGRWMLMPDRNGVPNLYVDSCPLCKQAPAKILTCTQDHNGKKTYRILCVECAMREDGFSG